ncbi:protein Obscurin-like isoform X4 [Tachypleus tridentatus]|uniref:protein Obscurin-like isoform X4 n=1 Tax=Tachypleus tridentatus TaxID=6853 RepID=UPI003FCFB6BB
MKYKSNSQILLYCQMVLGPPYFIQPLPPEVDVSKGGNITLLVQVAGVPHPLVSWYKCGDLLSHMNDRYKIYHDASGWHELVLTDLTEKDEGEYECRAENEYGYESCFTEIFLFDTDDETQSGLVILIDDGSRSDEDPEGQSNRKSLTASEQIQGIIEDLANGEVTGSLTFEEEDDLCSEFNLQDDVFDHLSSQDSLPGQENTAANVINNGYCLKDQSNYNIETNIEQYVDKPSQLTFSSGHTFEQIEQIEVDSPLTDLSFLSEFSGDDSNVSPGVYLLPDQVAKCIESVTNTSVKVNLLSAAQLSRSSKVNENQNVDPSTMPSEPKRLCFGINNNQDTTTSPRGAIHPLDDRWVWSSEQSDGQTIGCYCHDCCTSGKSMTNNNTKDLPSAKVDSSLRIVSSVNDCVVGDSSYTSNASLTEKSLVEPCQVVCKNFDSSEQDELNRLSRGHSFPSKSTFQSVSNNRSVSTFNYFTDCRISTASQSPKPDVLNNCSLTNIRNNNRAILSSTASTSYGWPNVACLEFSIVTQDNANLLERKVHPQNGRWLWSSDQNDGQEIGCYCHDSCNAEQMLTGSKKEEGRDATVMSYSRSSHKSSSLRYSDNLSDSSSLRSSSRISSSLFDTGDSLSSIRRSSRGATGLDDDLTSSVRRSTRPSQLEDDDSGLSSYRRSSRLRDEESLSSTRHSSRFSYRDEDSDSSLLSKGYRSSHLRDEDESTSALRLSSALTEKVESYSYQSSSKSELASHSSVSAYSDDTGKTAYSKSFRKESSLKESSYSTDSSGPKVGDVYAAILDYTPLENDKEGISLKEGQEVEIIDASKSYKWCVRTRPTSSEDIIEEGMVPSSYLEKKAAAIIESYSKTELTETKLDDKEKEAITKREAVVKELINTEKEFANDMQYVLNNYLTAMDNPQTPKEIRDKKGIIFSNFKDICEFHNNVLIKGVQYHSNEPQKLGITFSRLERDFDKHVNYYRDVPQAQAALETEPMKEYFDELRKNIGDVKSLSEHLELPKQKINDYQRLLKELIKFTSCLNEDTSDLERALDFMMSIPQRANDLKYLNSIQGYGGSINKLGRLIRHDWLEVVEPSGIKKEQYIFLFRGRMFVTDVKRTKQDEDSYMLQRIIKLSDVEIDKVENDDRALLCKHTNHDQTGFPLTLRAKTVEERDSWCQDLKVSSTPPTVEELKEEEEVILTSKKPKQQEPGEPDETKPGETPEKDEIPKEKTASPLPEKPSELARTKNGQEVEASERFQVAFNDDEDTLSLVFQRVTPEDSGVYTCVASASSGKISCNAELTVQGYVPVEPEAPSIKANLTDIGVSEGASTVLELKATGQPKPKIKWFKDDTEIEAGQRFRFLYDDDENYSLVIKNVRKEDGGSYSAKVTNDLGEAEASCTLTVTAHPKFLKEMKDVSVMTGEDVKFEVKVEGKPSPEVQWYKDSKLLVEDERIKAMHEEEETFTLTIRNVQQDDSGSYSCVAQNSGGSETGLGALIVNAPPSFVKKMKNVDAKNGETVNFCVQIAGNPRPKVKWLKDSDELTLDVDDTHYKITEDGDSYTLVIDKVTSNDVGKYTCEITNEYGTESTTGSLKVTGKPTLKFTQELSDIVATEGDSELQLLVKTEGAPASQIKWYLDDKEITENENVKISSDGDVHSLTIKRVMVESAGTYKCKAVNDQVEANTHGVLTVNVPAKFVQSLKDTDGVEDEKLSLTVKITGQPRPSVAWLKDEAELTIDGKCRKIIEEASDTFTLVLDKLTQEDTGKYTCKISNKYGSEDSSCKVNVWAQPKFTQKLKDVQATEGEKVSFTVKIAGSPAPGTKWLKDDAELTIDGTRYNVVKEASDSLTLVIESTTKEDEGKYSCEISNKYGKDVTSGKLSLESAGSKPKILEELKNVAAKPDENVELTVKITGSPKPEIKWTKNGEDVSAEATITIKEEADDVYILNIKKVSTNLYGEYQCQATNIFGEATTKMKLTELMAPKILKGLQDKEVWSGEEVKFEIKVSGEPEPKVSWFIEDEELTDSDHTKITSHEGTHCLHILDTELEDSGIYSCKIQNKAGEICLDAILTVKDSDDSVEPTFIHRMVDTIAVVDDAARFEIKVTGKPKPEITWFKDEEELTASKRIKIAADAEQNFYSLTVKDLTLEDTGNYSCIAMNSKGSASDKATLTVKEPMAPEIDGMKDVAVKKDSVAKFEVSVSGFPVPDIKWLKEGKTVHASDEIVLTSNEEKGLYSFAIKKVKNEDVATYACVASNSAGEVKKEAKVTIKVEPPTFLRELVHKNIQLGETVSFEARVFGFPQPEVSWYRGKAALSPDSHVQISQKDDVYRLEIQNVTEEDITCYCCQAINVAGEAKSMAYLQMKAVAPVLQKGLPSELPLQEGDQLMLQASLDGQPPPEITWLKDGEMLKPNDRTNIEALPDGTVKLTVSGVTPEDSGKYSLVAKNDKGIVGSDSQVTVKEEVKKVKPQFMKELKPVYAVKGEAVKLEANVEGQPQPKVTWLKNGKEFIPSDHIKISEKPDGTVTLAIDSCSPEDAGEYVVKASNEAGEASTGAPVTCKEKVKKVKPQFTKELKPVDAVKGEAIKLEAKVEGQPQPKVTWLKNGKEFILSDHIKISEKPDGTVTLAIDSCSPEDAGEYVVKASNEAGEASTGAPVTCKEKSKKKPEFAEGLEPTVLSEGEPAKIKAKITAEPKPTIQWKKDGKEIKPSDHLTPEEQPDGTVVLSFDKVIPEDAGKYSLVASNDQGERKCDAEVKTAPPVKKPEIEQGLFPTILTEGEPGRLEVKVTGEPKPDIQWLKDGKKLSSSTHFTPVEESDEIMALLIDEVVPADAGKYAAVVSNEKGEAKTEAKVTTTPKIVEVPKGKKPEFLKELEPTSVFEGESVNFHAQVAGDPEPAIKWMKDGELLQPSERTIITSQPDGKLSLQVKNANLNDTGKYVVVATNSEGKTRSAAQAEVNALPKKKPEIVEGLKPVTLTEGQPGRIEVNIKGDPTPELKWLKNGQEILPSDRISFKQQPDGAVGLVFDKVKPQDAGKYSVIAANDEGETRTCAPVSVSQPPIFVKPLQSVVGVEGFPTKLEAQLTGVPEPEVKWLKNGQEFKPDGEHIKALCTPDGVNSLLFSHTTPDAAAKYTCVAKNPLGEASSEGDLTVKGREKAEEPQSEPVFLSPLGDLSVKEGEQLRFETTVSGNPIPEVRWYLHEQPLLASDNVHKMFDGKKAVLEIKKSNPQHAGIYECHLINPSGEARSRGRAKVSALLAPKFIQQLADLDVPADELARLMCRVTGDPTPEIDWYFNGSLIEPGLKYCMSREGDLCTLTLFRPRIKDSGQYECRAKNSVGEGHCSAEIKVSDKAPKGEAPMFLKKVRDCGIMQGKTTRFTACVTGVPKPTIKWFKNGEQLEPGAHFEMEEERNGIVRLIIHCVQPEDVGEYRLSISNPYGSDTCTAKLFIEDIQDSPVPHPCGEEAAERERALKSGPPGPLPDVPRITRMTDNSLTLRWNPSIPVMPRVPVTYSVEFCRLPDGDWSLYRSGIKDSMCDIRGLEPKKDYRFRVRVENKYGTSDPSPYTTAYRSKLEPPAPGEYKPKDYEIEHPPLEKHSAPPRFIRREDETMYGIRGHPVTIEFWVYGYPEPKITWHFNGQKIELPGKYDYLQDRNGQLCLFITRMTQNDVGTYICHAVNQHGEASQKIKLLLAELPTFTKRLDETTVLIRKGGQLECCVSGIPYPKIKWFKDWNPLYESSRIKITWEKPDRCFLTLSDSILKDSGLYSVTASNVAGSATSSAMLNVEESEKEYSLWTYSYPHIVKPKTDLFEGLYDIGDELGRGTQGIVYHAVERTSGRSYAAKMMHGTGVLRDFMNAEMDIMNQLSHHRLVRLWDAFETKSSLTLVTDLCGGGELLNNIIQRTMLTESEVAFYIKQVLEGLEHMHSKNIGHLGLTIGDLLVTRVNSDVIKIGDFGLARYLHRGRDRYVEYGHPEFVAPEIVAKKPVSVAADMWSLGVITYLLLSGCSPFLGEDDRETLNKVQEGKYSFLLDGFAEVTDEGKDFISKLLVYDPQGRLDVKAALEHPWLKFAEVPGKADELSILDSLRDYAKKWKSWYANASCRRFYRRRPLESCYTHPSRMIYPPDETYTPPSSPEHHLQRSRVKPSEFDDVTFQQRIMREPIDVRSESRYESGPDSYLLQHRDVDFPVRVRRYLKVGADRSSTLASHLKEKHWGNSEVSVHERRRFTRLWDEEMDDKKRRRDRALWLSQESKPTYQHTDSKKSKGTKEEGKPPFFREKIKEAVIRDEEDVKFSCYAVGNPTPTYTWFRNDGFLVVTSRIESKVNLDGRCELHLKPGKSYDAGVYKCIAQNKHGAAICRARLKLGETPGKPDCPHPEKCSDTEVTLSWHPPKYDGNSQILCYCLEYKRADETTWTKTSSNITHEFFMVCNLTPSTTYHFRVSARNKFAWSEASEPSEPCSTLAAGAEKIRITRAQKHWQELSLKDQDLIVDDSLTCRLDYSVEENPIPMEVKDPTQFYNFESEIARGQFSVIVKMSTKDANQTFAGKVIHTTNQNVTEVCREYDILKTLKHENIASLISAVSHNDLTILMFEKLSGIDVLSYLSMRHQYNEETVMKIIQQVLGALGYLHFRGICYLELQPDNVVMVDQQWPVVKLVDFGAAQYIPEEGAKIDIKGRLEYMAPEIVTKKEVNSASDVWGVSVLTYILLSGVSPFLGETEQETADNITCVCYRFDHLYSEATQEATHFLMHIFKRTPQKRLTVEECLENKWLLPSEFMIKKREQAVFLSHWLTKFSEKFHSEKQSATPQRLLNISGTSLPRSLFLETGIYEEL